MLNFESCCLVHLSSSSVHQLCPVTHNGGWFVLYKTLVFAKQYNNLFPTQISVLMLFPLFARQQRAPCNTCILPVVQHSYCRAGG